MRRQTDLTQRDVARIKLLRKGIDGLDQELLRLLNRRAKLAVQVGHIKRRHNTPVLDRRREQQVLRQILRANRGPLSASALRMIYRTLLKLSRTLERYISQAR